ncbi:chemotaxis protein CheB [Nitrosococcus wardiae]|uniref:protein-glutamate methylesterase n=1 Tax=Nitrosococcus wardiae TaxID=1814290 RepID=A0A4P7BW79_9GAMM|nr:chemotaxis protein CheB [Nitrosococcus wardiae]QBQ54303.1 chemotaxis protein CheB [Nitrosococcus wardiae]
MTATQAEAIVIGASAGALEALSILLPALPQDYPLPIMVVVHLSPDRESMLAELLRAKCSLDAREVEDKEPIQGGTIYFAPPDYHLLVEVDKHLSLSIEEPVHHSRPSIDVLFETAADAYGAALIGIVLTGASNDGSQGLKAVVSAGGTALIQRPDLAYIPTMPQAALDACPEAQVMSLEQITAYLQERSTPL